MYYLENPELTEDQRETLKRFDDEKSASGKGASIYNRINYARIMCDLGREQGKPYVEITKTEIISFINELVNRKGDPLSDSTKNLYKIVLKRFYRWLYDLPKGQYPEQVSWIETTRSKSGVTVDDLVTPEELKRMINASKNSRDRAIIATLWETAFRAGEFLSMRVGSVEEVPYGFKLTAQISKTETRTIPITMTARYMAQWLNDHPMRDDPSAPLWVSFGSNTLGQPITTDKRLNAIIKGCAKRAGIKRRIHAHLFRHTRLTNLTKMGVREAQLKGVAGWASDSTMPGIYVHLSGIDVEDAVLRANGIEKEPPKPTLRPMVCARCGLENEPTAIWCNRCGTGLREKIDEPKVMVTEGTIDEIAGKVIEDKLGDKFRELEQERKAVQEEREKLRQYSEKLMQMANKLGINLEG